MKKYISLFFSGVLYVCISAVAIGQNNSVNSKNFVFDNAVEFLQMHTGIAADQFDEKSFKYHSNALINGVRVSGMYVSTKADKDGVAYDFFIRTDNPEQAGPYVAFQVNGCIVSRAAGLASFTTDGSGCTCKVKNSRNFTLRARDVNAIFTK